MAARLFSPAGGLLKQSKVLFNGAGGSIRASSGLGYKQAIANMPATQLTVLDNNMRVATEEVAGPSATVGVFLESGSRYEKESNNGVGRFLERMSFKGTQKRSAEALELEVASMGGNITSYTDREQSAFIGNCQKKDVPRMIEILSDIVQNSSIDQTEVENQRAVLLKEMQEQESMDTIVFNHMHSLAFQGTPLALNPHGTASNISSISRDDLLSFRNNNYCSPRMVLAAAGDVDHKAVADLTNQHFGKLKADDDSPSMPVYCRYTGSEVRMRDDDMPHANIVLALKGCGTDNPDHLVLELASTLLGSWDKTSPGGINTSFKLAKACSAGNLGEQYKAFNISYRDTGLFGCHLTSYKLTIEDLMYNFHLELMRFCETVTEFDVERAKNVLRTRIMLEHRHPANICKQIGTQTINYGRKIPLAELDAQIREIDGSIFREVCTNYIYDKCPVVVAVGCIEQLYTYLNIRSNLYWLRV